MVSVELDCTGDERDELLAEFVGSETGGIRETDTAIEVFFDTREQAEPVMQQFAARSPRLKEHGDVDYVAQFQEAWPAVAVGQRWWLTAPWDPAPPPEGRVRVEYQVGMACGTGAHPCTQLCLEELERHLAPGGRVLDVGVGSGILLLASRSLFASRVVGCDIDEDSVRIAKEAGLPVFVGSADAVRSQSFDVVVANISSQAAEQLEHDLLRVCTPAGAVILSGFRADDLPELETRGSVNQTDEWAAVTLSHPRSSGQS